MSPIRVLSVFWTFRPALSGEAEWWLQMIPLLNRRGVDVEVLTSSPGPSGTNGDPETVGGVRVYRVCSNGGKPSRVRAVETIRAMLSRRRQFDVALFHSPNQDAVYASCILGRVLGWKTVYKMTLFKSDDLLSIRATGRLGPARVAALRLADGLIAISGALARTVEEAGLSPHRLFVAPPGVDTTRFRPADPADKRAMRKQLGIPADARVALFCGGVIYRKGVDVLLEAWRSISTEVEGAVLIIVGPNHLHGLTDPHDRRFSEQIAQRIATFGLADSVRLLGHQQRAERFFAAADAFVFPSRSEGWPNVIAEAMATGLPCVVSWLDGTATEQLGDTGIILRSGEPAEYAAQVIRVLRDQATAEAMGRAARRRVVEQFDIERIADRYAVFLRHVLQAPAPARAGEMTG
jgi:glycosyltransferase involved in cell wall biosynthesis